jgi:hypothetical protein
MTVRRNVRKYSSGNNRSHRCGAYRKPDRAAFVANGYNVVISNSRGPETFSELLAEFGTKARAATVVEASRFGDIVVVTIPLKNYHTVPVEPLAGVHSL